LRFAGTARVKDASAMTTKPKQGLIAALVRNVRRTFAPRYRADVPARAGKLEPIANVVARIGRETPAPG